MEETFTRIYTENAWGSLETLSGLGSTIFNTGAIRTELPILINELRIQSMLDIPCGDFHWMKEVPLEIDEYIGADIIQRMAETNTVNYGNECRKFFHWDITRDKLPKVDLIFCRDCFVHFSFRDIFEAIHNIKRSTSLYLLTTTFTSITENVNITTGGWRPINLQESPFYFPPPLRLIREHRIWDGGDRTDKGMGLWMIEDITM